MGTKLLVFSIGRGSGALKGLIACYPPPRLLLLLCLTVTAHDVYENTFKCGELKLYFSPSAGGFTKKKLGLSTGSVFFAYIPPVMFPFFPPFLPKRNSDPGSESRLFSLFPATVGVSIVIARRLQPFLPSSTRMALLVDIDLSIVWLWNATNHRLDTGAIIP